MVTIEEQVECVERELGYRERVYARRVEAGKMSQQQATRELERMAAVLETLRGLAELRPTSPKLL